MDRDCDGKARGNAHPRDGNGRGRVGSSAAGTAPILITGGAGFVGTNLADRLLREGHRVRVFDNFARPGVERNAAYLEHEHGERVEIVRGDVRDAEAVADAVSDAAAVFHFAAQVAVTTSLDDPVGDFEVNLRGTLNVLEALRRRQDRRPRHNREPAPALLFTSTNKVYGDLAHLELVQRDDRYEPADPEARARGVAEIGLDFHSPYGCSKGGADQYVLDYARSYELPAMVFRMSCIYGPHQCGNEDQGWVAHFLLRAMRGESITLYGDGRQVRDVLFVDDLVDAMLLAVGHPERTAGRAFNIGGGPMNAVSLLQMIDLIAEANGERPGVSFGPWRRGDQRYYVSDTTALDRAIGWSPTTSVASGVDRLHAWLREHGRVAAAPRVGLKTCSKTTKDSAPAALYRGSSPAAIARRAASGEVKA